MSLRSPWIWLSMFWEISDFYFRRRLRYSNIYQIKSDMFKFLIISWCNVSAEVQRDSNRIGRLHGNRRIWFRGPHASKPFYHLGGTTRWLLPGHSAAHLHTIRNIQHKVGFEEQREFAHSLCHYWNRTMCWKFWCSLSIFWVCL